MVKNSGDELKEKKLTAKSKQFYSSHVDLHPHVGKMHNLVQVLAGKESHQADQKEKYHASSI